MTAAILRARYAAGVCVTCQQPHGHVNSKTGMRTWRCVPCGVKHVEAMRRSKDKEIKAQLQPKPVPVVVLPVARVRVRTRVKVPIQKHISQSVFLRHDPIAARYSWAQAVGVK